MCLIGWATAEHLGLVSSVKIVYVDCLVGEMNSSLVVYVCPALSRGPSCPKALLIRTTWQVNQLETLMLLIKRVKLIYSTSGLLLFCTEGKRAALSGVTRQRLCFVLHVDPEHLHCGKLA